MPACEITGLACEFNVLVEIELCILSTKINSWLRIAGSSTCHSMTFGKPPSPVKYQHSRTSMCLFRHIRDVHQPQNTAFFYTRISFIKSVECFVSLHGELLTLFDHGFERSNCSMSPSGLLLFPIFAAISWHSPTFVHFFFTFNKIYFYFTVWDILMETTRPGLRSNAAKG